MNDLTETLDMPRMRLVKPGEKSISYSNPATLTEESLAESQEEFEAYRNHLEGFYAIVSEGVLLNRVLGLTSSQSFMAQCLERVKQDSSFRNSLSEMLHGAHTRSHLSVVHLPWISIYTDYFSSTPIPENLDAIREANASLVTLADLVANNREFYDSFRAGVRAPVLNDTSAFGMHGIEGLSMTVFANEQAVRPEKVTADSSTIQVGDQVFYNGLPADRAQYLTLLMQEGSQIAVTVKNNTKNKLYMVLPTINGIPMKLDHLGFYYDGFRSSSFPISGIEPLTTYLKPGEEATFDHFYVRNAGFASSFGGSISLSYFLPSGSLPFILGRNFDRQMTEDQRRLIESCKDEDLRQQIIYESRLTAAEQFQAHLGKSRQAPIYISRPEIADGKASSELSNPMLGSLGMLVVDVTRPPVKDTHRHTLSVETYGAGTTRCVTMGGAGLSHISGGADRGAEREDFWTNHQYSDLIHTFAGYMPLNIMSLRG